MLMPNPTTQILGCGPRQLGHCKSAGSARTPPTIQSHLPPLLASLPEPQTQQPPPPLSHAQLSLIAWALSLIAWALQGSVLGPTFPLIVTQLSVQMSLPQGGLSTLGEHRLSQCMVSPTPSLTKLVENSESCGKQGAPHTHQRVGARWMPAELMNKQTNHQRHRPSNVRVY